MRLTSKDIALLSASEQALLQSRGPWQVKDLVRVIERVRNVRDKASDLLRRQTVALRQGRGAERAVSANQRSQAKLDLLQRALQSFRLELEQLDAESSQAVAALRAAEATPESAPMPVAVKPKTAAKPSAVAKQAKSKAPRANVVENVTAGGAPKVQVSSKARVRLAPKSAGLTGSQVHSLAGQRTRAKKSRPG